jgi:uncharacterized protein DUF6516
MAGARAYLEGVERLLLQIGVGQVDIRAPEHDEAGQLRATLRTGARCRLMVDIRMRFSGSPSLHAYSFELLDGDDNHILRFDNVRHHRDLPGFPHHCHRAGRPPEGVMPEPSIRTILGAIEDEIEGRLAYRPSTM